MKSTKENKKTTRRPVSRNKKTDDNTEFPGYPHYAPEEDIMNKAKRVDLDLDEGETADKINDQFSRQNRVTPEINESIVDKQSEVTKEDLEALGPKDLSLDMGDDENLLKHRVYPVDFSGKDIDIPGSELDDASEAIGAEDEENNSYSIGGDAHDNLEEDPS
jgi:hypothetical protein